MKNKTLRVIIILIGLLVLNIEAAHAGITHKFKVFINHELSDFQQLYVGGGIVSLGLLCYIIFMPAFKEKGNFGIRGGYFQNFSVHTFQKKRNRVKKIAEILKNA